MYVAVLLFNYFIGWRIANLPRNISFMEIVFVRLLWFVEKKGMEWKGREGDGVEVKEREGEGGNVFQRAEYHGGQRKTLLPNK